MQRTAILPHVATKNGSFSALIRGRGPATLPAFGKLLLRLLPPAQILIVLIGAAAELFLILGGDLLAVRVRGRAPLRQFRAACRL